MCEINLKINSNIIAHRIPVLFFLDSVVINAILNTQRVIKIIIVDKVSCILIPSDNPPHTVFIRVNNIGRVHINTLFLIISTGVIATQINIIVIL